MQKERWERVQHLFEQALSLDPKARETYLTDACGDDIKMLEELKELIGTESEASQYFQRLEGKLVEAIVESDFYPLQSGQRIGPYEVVKQIAAGGMSLIYEAKRAEGDFEQRLVLKVLKKGLDTADVLRRFRSEKQILARLNHPAIAQIFDGGVTEEGTPYFVMEYIAGDTLMDYVAKNMPNLRERLLLFKQIGEALQFAHRNLVIHRDLKPSNILVTTEGRPKLLDFGIAKLLEPEDFNLTRAETQAGHELLTPDYASPEQLSGGSVTTSTDIYQLGLVLYELLAEQKPFEFKGLSYQERRDLIQNASPEPPSQRHPSPSLSKKVKGELDNIVLMALRKEPERRYLSVEQFLTDLRRFEIGRPILAKKDTWRYRLSKFYQRNRFPVTLSAAALVMVAMLSVIYTLRVTKERDR
ncbi:MAG: serine/threonine-protein kinase, partial [Bacteroidota bacterium]